MDVPVQAVLFLGIIPALVFLYIALKGYEGHYKDKTIFLTFIIGIVLGVIAAVARLLINPPFLLPTLDISIYPGYTFKSKTAAMISNFHLPKSTLLLMVSAFAGRNLIFKAYRKAIKEQYRFYSFGDAMFLFKEYTQPQ